MSRLGSVQLAEYLKANPGSKPAEIATTFGVSIHVVRALMDFLDTKHDRQARLTAMVGATLVPCKRRKS